MSFPTTDVPTVPLRGGTEIPQLGFGVFQVPPPDTEEVTLARAPGRLPPHRHRPAYQNEAEVGQAVRASGLGRDEVFVTTKCFNDDHGYDQATRALKASLGRLEMELRRPLPDPLAGARARPLRRDLAGARRGPEGGPRAVDRRLELPAAHLERIIEETGVEPAVNQIELHPRLQQVGLRREHADLGIVTEAWSPLAQGAVLDDPVITEIAANHGKTTGQVVLRWHIQLGNVVFPKSVTPERIEENFDIFDFHLSEDDMGRIAELDRGERIGPDPDTFVMP